MRVRTLLLYLIGNRQAILDLAADRRALWVGLLFVLSAGFAREYDGQDLLHEPWHLLIPVGASLGAASLLFAVVCAPIFLRGEARVPVFTAYRSFLTLFWLTAPLAWLYAIPYERFLSPAAATEANLWTLALVAAWRVLLMTRVVSVLTGRRLLTSFLLVMVFADAVALTAVMMMPKPVVSFMGGVRHTESERVISEVSFLVLGLGFLSAPVWLIGGLIAETLAKPWWVVSPDPPRHSGGALWALAVASLLVWLPILPYTQPEQALRWRTELALKGGRMEEGLDLMSAHTRADYPPHWDPPPRIGYGENNPDRIAVMFAVLTRESAPWVRDIYSNKFRDFAEDPYGMMLGMHQGPQLARVVQILQRLPDGPEIAARNADVTKLRLNDSGLSEEDRESLTALLALAEKAKKPKP